MSKKYSKFLAFLMAVTVFTTTFGSDYATAKVFADDEVGMITTIEQPGENGMTEEAQTQESDASDENEAQTEENATPTEESAPSEEGTPVEEGTASDEVAAPAEETAATDEVAALATTEAQVEGATTEENAITSETAGTEAKADEALTKSTDGEKTESAEADEKTDEEKKAVTGEVQLKTTALRGTAGGDSAENSEGTEADQSAAQYTINVGFTIDPEGAGNISNSDIEPIVIKEDSENIENPVFVATAEDGFVLKGIEVTLNDELVYEGEANEYTLEVKSFDEYANSDVTEYNYNITARFEKAAVAVAATNAITVPIKYGVNYTAFGSIKDDKNSDELIVSETDTHFKDENGGATAVPAPGYKFVRWRDENFETVPSTVNENGEGVFVPQISYEDVKDEDPVRTRNYVAEFEKEESSSYDVTLTYKVNNEEAGSIVNANNEATSGDSIVVKEDGSTYKSEEEIGNRVVKAVANEGYVFVNWTDENGDVISADENGEFTPNLGWDDIDKTNPKTSYTYTANFDKKANPVTVDIEYAVNNAKYGHIEIEGGELTDQIVVTMEGATFKSTGEGSGRVAKAVANEGYVFTKWVDEAGNVLSTDENGEFSVKAPTWQEITADGADTNRTYKAVFEEAKGKVTVEWYIAGNRASRSKVYSVGDTPVYEGTPQRVIHGPDAKNTAVEFIGWTTDRNFDANTDRITEFPEITKQDAAGKNPVIRYYAVFKSDLYVYFLYPEPDVDETNKSNWVYMYCGMGSAVVPYDFPSNGRWYIYDHPIDRYVMTRPSESEIEESLIKYFDGTNGKELYDPNTWNWSLSDMTFSANKGAADRDKNPIPAVQGWSTLHLDCVLGTDTGKKADITYDVRYYTGKEQEFAQVYYNTTKHNKKDIVAINDTVDLSGESFTTDGYTYDVRKTISGEILVFDGWYTDPSYTQPAQAPGKVEVNGPLWYYGRYLPIANIHTVTYIFNNGQQNETYSYPTNSIVNLRSDPVWAKHVFTGWTFYTVENEGKSTRYEKEFTIGDAKLFKMPDRNVRIYAHWDPQYTVEYYLQDAEGEGYTFRESYVSSGAAGTKAVPVEKTYTNFVLNKSKTTPSDFTIKADGSLVIKLYYDRNAANYIVNHWKVEADGSVETTPTLTQTESGRIGAPATYAPTTITNYTYVASRTKAFIGSTEASLTDLKIPAEEQLVINLYYTIDRHSYKIEYYLQNDKLSTKLDDYVLQSDETVTKTSVAYGSPVTYDTKAEKFPGFTFREMVTDPANTTTVPANDGLVVKLYFDRNTVDYTVKHWKVDENNNIAETPEKIENLSGKVGTAAVYGPQNIVGYTYDATRTTAYVDTTKVATDDLKIPAQGSLVINLYYTVNKYSYKVEYYLQNENLSTDLKDYELQKEETVIKKNVAYGTPATYETKEAKFPGFTLGEVIYDPSGVTTVPANNDLVIRIYFSRNTGTAYKVKYFLQNVDLKGYTLDQTVNKAGKTGEIAKFTVIPYEGFTYDSSLTEYHGSVEGQNRILGDGTLEIWLYYTRNQYKVSYKYVGDVIPEDVKPAAADLPENKYAVGETVTVIDDPVVPEGYIFNGWESSVQTTEAQKPVLVKVADYIKTILGQTVSGDKLQFTMPAHDIEFVGSFTLIQHTVTYIWKTEEGKEVSEKYTVDHGKLTPIVVGTDFEKPATPTGYYFVNWTDDKGKVVTLDELQKKAVVEDATYTANYEAKRNIKLTATADAESLTKYYDGKPISSKVTADQEPKAGHKLVYTLAATVTDNGKKVAIDGVDSVSITDVSTVTYKVATAKIMNGDEDVTYQYVIDMGNEATLEVKAIPVVIEAHSAMKEFFDGTPLTNSEYDVYVAKDSDVPAASKAIFEKQKSGITAVIEGELFKAGECPNLVVSHSFDESIAKAQNYVVSYVHGVLKIGDNKIAIVIKADVDGQKEETVVYNGELQRTVADVNVSVTSEVKESKVTKGLYDAIKEIMGIFVITAHAADVEKTITYGGVTYTVGGLTLEGGEGIVVGDYPITLDTKNIKVTVVVDGKEVDVSDQFDITIDTSATSVTKETIGYLHIIPAPVTVTAEDKSKVKGQVDPELTAVVAPENKKLYDEAAQTIKYTLSRTAGEDVGSYPITPAGTELQGNFKVKYIPGTLTITDSTTPPPPEPGPTPDPTPDPDPTPTPTPTPTPVANPAVLGARRDTGTPQAAVLGARRSKTDDETNLPGRALAIILAALAAGTLIVTGKKKEDKES